MRSVKKGTAPNVYTKYQDAGQDLQTQLGDYCSYCERRIETHLAVEHIQPKSLVPNLATSWNNFLLACVNCNSCKGDTSINIPDYLWPDVDNTMRAFEYIPGGLLQASSSLPSILLTRAKATIALTGLDRYPGSPNGEPTSLDKRWSRRQELWQLAMDSHRKLIRNNTIEVRELIVQVAIARGMFSIWWTVFMGDIDMRRRLRQAFVGTDPTSFDQNENLVQRPGGQL